MEALLTNVGLIVTAGIGWVGQVSTAVVDQPILTLFVVLPLVGLGVGLFKRLLNVG